MHDPYLTLSTASMRGESDRAYASSLPAHGWQPNEHRRRRNDSSDMGYPAVEVTPVAKRDRGR